MSKLPRVPYSLTDARVKALADASVILGTDGATATIEAALRMVVTGRPSSQLTLPAPSAPLSSSPSLASRLKSARVAAGLSQRELGELVGYSRATVVSCENTGREMPDALRAWVEQQERGS